MITWYANIFSYAYFQLPQLKRMNTSLGNIDNVRQKVFGNTRLKLSLLPVVFWTLYSEDKLDETYVNLKRTLNSYFNVKSIFDAKLIFFFQNSILKIAVFQFHRIITMLSASSKLKFKSKLQQHYYSLTAAHNQ